MLKKATMGYSKILSWNMTGGMEKNWKGIWEG
jgi:hypothetical protein